MKTCPKCGAYIPDGRDTCLACGYTLNSSGSASAASGATAQQQAPRQDANPFENVHSQVEEDTNAYNGSGTGKTRTYDYGRPSAAQSRNYKTDRGYRHSYEEGMEDGKKKSGSEIFSAILSYFGPLWILPLLRKASNNPPSKFVMFHANQGLVLFILEVLIAVFAGATGLSELFDLVTSVLSIIGIINASKGQMKPLPLIGGITLIR